MKKPKRPATTKVNRVELMKLLHRYKGLLEWEIGLLAELRGETVDLVLPPPEGPYVKRVALMASGSGQADAGAQAQASADATRTGNLENACRYSIPTIDSYGELVDAATPYVRALADA